MYNEDYLNHNAYYGRGSDDYNFPVEVMKDSSDLLGLIKQGNRIEEGIPNGASLIITEKQYVMAFNKGRGIGRHDSTLARIYADITDQATLGYVTIELYRRSAEKELLHARIFCQKEEETRNIYKIITFSFNREKKISQKEFNSFMDFYNEYAWVFQREKFQVYLMGKTMPSIESVKDVLESMIDKDFSLPESFTSKERIIGVETNKNDNLISK